MVIVLRLEPIHQLLDERVDARAAGIEPHVRMLVGVAPRVVQPLVRRAARNGGER